MTKDAKAEFHKHFFFMGEIWIVYNIRLSASDFQVFPNTYSGT